MNSIGLVLAPTRWTPSQYPKKNRQHQMRPITNKSQNKNKLRENMSSAAFSRKIKKKSGETNHNKPPYSKIGRKLQPYENNISIYSVTLPIILYVRASRLKSQNKKICWFNSEKLLNKFVRSSINCWYYSEDDRVGW